MINWNITKEDHELVNKIVDRVQKGAEKHDFPLDRMSTYMDISACHLNDNPLRLTELLEADDFNFFHDTIGISRHIDRETGKLLNCFVPRYSS